MSRPDDSPPPHVMCGACGQPPRDHAGTIPFYLKTGEIQTALWRCDHCATYSRDAYFESPLLRGHFEVASYTNLSAEERLRTTRAGFFIEIAKWIEQFHRRTLRGARVLDVGCAFGHLLETLHESGALPEGVEIVDGLRELATQRGLIVHATLDSLPEQSYDVVTAIDSLYYADSPIKLLERVRALLKPDGILVIRIANRVWLLDALRALGIEIGRDHFGDAKHNFSPQGAVGLLLRAGFDIASVRWMERGKRDPRAFMRVYYWVSGVISELLSIRISPGMLIIARPAKPFSSASVL